MTTYQKIIDSNFETSFDGWQQNGTVNYTLENGRVKANVNSAWEGIRYDFQNFTVTPGEKHFNLR